MGRKLFVGNLSFETSDDDLKEAFSKAGSCEMAAVIKDRLTGRSRGFGFVEMGTDEEAQRAIAELNGKDLRGRNISVSEARERSESRGPRPMSSGFGGGESSRFGDNRPPAGPRFRKDGGSRRGVRARKRSL
jgi:RNA recognition motif-containing protein